MMNGEHLLTWPSGSLVNSHSYLDVLYLKHDEVTLPAPGVLSITGQWTELVIGESVVQVTVVGVVEHGFDPLSETWNHSVTALSCFTDDNSMLCANKGYDSLPQM